MSNTVVYRTDLRTASKLKRLAKFVLRPLLRKKTNSQPNQQSLGAFDIGEEIWNMAQCQADSYSHFGKKLSVGVAAAKLNPKPGGYPAEYDVIKQEFDFAYYLSRYPDILGKRLDPVAHYIRAGAKEGRDPSPYFSTKRYMSRYPEVADSHLTPFGHWLAEGRKKGYIGSPFENFSKVSHVLQRSAQEVQEMLLERHSDLRVRLENGVLGEMVAKAAALDPIVEHSWPSALHIRVPPFSNQVSVNRVSSIYAAQEEADFRPAKAVILINRPRWGGGRRAEGHIAHALAKIYGAREVAVIATDGSGEIPEGKFPEGVRYIDLPACMTGLRKDHLQRALIEFIRSLQPIIIFTINSNLFWSSLNSFGKALSKSTRIVGLMFCNEKNDMGHWMGYPVKHFYRHFDIFSFICTDSKYLANKLRNTYLVPPSQQARIQVLSAPVDPSLPTFPHPTTNVRPQIFWSGRFDPQKRIDIVYDLAREMPEADFRMWGEPVMANAVMPEKPANVIHEGVYSTFKDLPLHEADLWLYTSEWDGVPSILLELSMTGIPIVGSKAGGTEEILQEELAWPIDDLDNIQAYKTAIEQILQNPQTARNRALRLREIMLSERTQESYRDAIAGVLPREVA